MQATGIPANRISKARLSTRREFLRVQRGGIRYKGRFIVFMARGIYEQSSLGRFGLVAPKTMGLAHQRNKIKRQMRHLVLQFPELLAGQDVVLLATAQCVDARFDELQADFANASRHLINRRQNKSSARENAGPNKVFQGETHVHRVAV